MALIGVGLGSPQSSNATTQREALSPVATSFISPSTGWVLGVTRCSKTHDCVELKKTSNAGRSWSTVHLSDAIQRQADQVPPASAPHEYLTSTLSVDFANDHDGWVYGYVTVAQGFGGSADTSVTRLWSTHNGGTTWRAQNVGALAMTYGILDVASSHGVVHAMGFANEAYLSVRSSPISHDQWRRSTSTKFSLPAGGSNFAGSFTFSGRSSWLVAGNDRGITASARLSAHGTWTPLTPPCEAVGDSYVVPSALNGSELVVACTIGGYASNLTKSAPPGAKRGSLWLYVSHNGGVSFSALRELRSGPCCTYLDSYPGNPTSLSNSTILVSVPQVNGEALIRSTNSGATWSVVFRGQLIALEFNSSTQGFGIVQRSTTRNALITTDDGGGHWRVLAL